MSKHFKLKRGLDIRLKGKAELVTNSSPTPKTVALKPTDFPGLTPKLSVKADAKVKAGDALFFDKYHPEILFTSPVSGTVKSINRGERRRILEVVVEPDGQNEFVSFHQGDPLKLKDDEIKSELLKSGIWPFIQQRPYGIVADPSVTPRDIFVSGFDSAPLAADYDYLFAKEQANLQTGFNALSKLTKGKVFLSLHQTQENGPLSQFKNVEINYFEGPHPAGNVGIQIFHLAPINKGDKVWTVSMQSVAYIGRLFNEGKLDLQKTIALNGSEVVAPQYYTVLHGEELDGLLAGKTKKETNERYISGNVLTGTRVEPDGYLGFTDQQITVIPEGDEYEAFGWMTPGVDKFSASGTFFSKLFPKKEYTLNANLHGDERAFVVSGQYEKLLPMDIYPVFLLKAALANDIDKMEQLGIYEVIEEDLALCEYACTSKIKVQDILRQGLNSMMKELG